MIRPDSPRELRHRFIREALIVGRLEHPNIVPIHQLGTDDNKRFFFTMKRVEGKTLTRFIEELACRQSTATLVERLRIFMQICDAMDYSHSRGVLHRDLKPSNIMIGPFGEVLVMDWGLSRMGHDTTDGISLSTTLQQRLGQGIVLDDQSTPGEVIGTPGYMPPEQALGQMEQADERSDIYGLGILLYELLSLATPYKGNRNQLLAQTIRGDPPSPSVSAPEENIPWELDHVVLRAMARRPADRYPSVAELRADVQAFLEARPIAAVRYSTRQLASKWARRHPVICSATLGVLFTGLFGVIGIYRQMRVAQIERVEAITARNQVALREVELRREREKLRVKIDDFKSMSDIRLLSELTHQREELGPQTWKVKALRSWLNRAHAMHKRLPRHRGVIARLSDLEDPNIAQRWQLGVVRELVANLDKLLPEIAEIEHWEELASRKGTRPQADQTLWRKAAA